MRFGGGLTSTGEWQSGHLTVPPICLRRTYSRVPHKWQSTPISSSSDGVPARGFGRNGSASEPGWGQTGAAGAAGGLVGNGAGAVAGEGGVDVTDAAAERPGDAAVLGGGAVRFAG